METSNKNSSAAKERWKLLAQALKRKEKDKFESSVRNFVSYELYCIAKHEQMDTKGTEKWYSYQLKKSKVVSPISVRFLSDQFTAEELFGFNNTGNVCIWPSEEILSYYCDKFQHLLKNKRILELGCGMSALAGLQIATTIETQRVCLSDGNSKGIENLNVMLEANKGKLLHSSNVDTLLLEWNEDIAVDKNIQHLAKSFDVIISADCLFFTNFHKALLNTIQFLLALDGIGIFFAPRRSGTLDKFVELAKEVFDVTVEENYDDDIWRKYQGFKQTIDNFNEDLHYPILVSFKGKGNIL